MYNQDYDGTYDEPYPTPQPTSPTSGPVVGMTPVSGHPGLYYNTAGVVFDGTGQQVDGYVNPATGDFQTGAPNTNPDTGIIEPPTPAPTQSTTDTGTPTMPPVVEPPPPTPAPPPPLTTPPPPIGGRGTPTPTPLPTPTPPPAPGPGTGPPAPIPDPTPTPKPAPNPGPGPEPPPSTAPPQPTPPPAFHYDDFTPPDPKDLENDPGFKFENEEGMRAIGARNAALGTLNTGGTLKDFVTFGQNLAHTRYNDMFDRSLRTYGTQRGNALETYNTNYGTQYQDPWNESMQRAKFDQDNNHFNAGLDENGRQFDAGLKQQRDQYNGNMSFNEWLEQYKRSVLDPFDEKYKTLSLM